MAEYIVKMPNKVNARHYLIMILNIIRDKFAALNQQYPNTVKLSKLYAQQLVDGSPDNYLADKDHLPNWDEIDIFITLIKTLNPQDQLRDPEDSTWSISKHLFRLETRCPKQVASRQERVLAWDILRACVQK